MRKLFQFVMTTLDGYFEGPEGEINWHNVDDEFNEFAIEQIAEADTMIFGRRTYELMESYWPGQEARNDDPIVAGLMNGYPKLVVSRTLEEASWENTRLLGENMETELSALKQQAGKDLILMGSPNLSVSLLQAGLIDEIRVMVNPVILGKGNSLFEGIEAQVQLQLLKTRTFKSGNVLLYYQPIYPIRPTN